MSVSPVRLNHAVLFVADLDRSVRFYTDVFGMDVVAREPRANAAFLRLPRSGNHHDLGLFGVGTAAARSVAAPSASTTWPGSSTRSTSSPPPARHSSTPAPTPASRATAPPRASTAPTPTATSSSSCGCCPATSGVPTRNSVTPPDHDGGMDLAAVVEQVQQVAAVRADDTAGRAELEAAMRAVGRLQSWLAGTKAALTSRLAAQVSFPEQTIAECTRGTTRDAIKDKERADTLAVAPSLASALENADVSAGHVDEVTRATKHLEGEQRQELLDRLEHGGLLDVAAVASVEEWRRRLAVEVNNIRRDDGIDRLERQQRATRLRTWTDNEGMWCISGRFDPVTGVRVAARLDQTVDALFAEATPDTCPTDPIDKQHHLRALALAEMLNGTGSGARPGRPEYVVVIDTTQPDGAGGPIVDWGLPVEIPGRILTEMTGDGDVAAVVVRNGVILHAPGEIDLGRTTRLANRAQRRALRALYATCAIPGCSVRFDRCKLHHVIWWRHGGRTDLDNMLPVCAAPPQQDPRPPLGHQPRPEPRAHHPLPRRHHPMHRATQPPSRLTSGPGRRVIRQPAAGAQSSRRGS
jgi:catechol 2,3-dioxygenase-like lactoylglutathione lyase family enzyme